MLFVIELFFSVPSDSGAFFLTLVNEPTFSTVAVIRYRPTSASAAACWRFIPLFRLADRFQRIALQPSIVAIDALRFPPPVVFRPESHIRDCSIAFVRGTEHVTGVDCRVEDFCRSLQPPVRNPPLVR